MECENTLIQIRDLAIEQVGRPDILIELNPDPTVDNFQLLQDQLTALPDGTAEHPVTARLPEGEFHISQGMSNTVGVQLAQKQYVRLVGPGPELCTLRWDDYGPFYNNKYARRHLKIDDCTHVEVGGFRIHGPHSSVSSSDPTRAAYVTNKEFQHGFHITESRNVTVRDVQVYQIAGDGMYLNDVDDLLVEDMRVDFNGRQGVAGIQGNRWVFNRLHIEHSARTSIDWEPIGHLPSGESRWIDDVQLNDCYLHGKLGVVFHRCSGQVIRGGHIPSKPIKMSGSSDELKARRTLVLDGVQLPDPWLPKTSKFPVISVFAFKDLTVVNCRTGRPTGNNSSRWSPMVRFEGGCTGSITVKNNTATDFFTAVGTNLDELARDQQVPAIEWDVGTNDLGNGVIEGTPNWIADRL